MRVSKYCPRVAFGSLPTSASVISSPTLLSSPLQQTTTSGTSTLHYHNQNHQYQQRRAMRIDKPTKDLDSVGKMLDIYARRDPQLAPYLLREVDIEFKRKNTKVRFVVWSMIFVFMFILNERMNCEEIHHLRRYVEVMQLEEDEKALDSDIRRAKLVAFLALVRQAYDRDQKWTAADTKKAQDIFREQVEL